MIALATIAAGALVVPAPAAAYIDPVSGSVLLQVIVAGALAFTFSMKRSIKSFIGLFRPRNRRPPDQ